jgi:hypothetical protein
MANFATVTNNIMADSGIAAFQSTSGTVGISGTNGGIGASGTNGVSGTDGSSGTNGLSALSGSSGTSGANGGNGSNAASGVSGSSGSSGTNGSSGTSGSSGVGAAGTNGSSGTSGFGGTANISPFNNVLLYYNTGVTFTGNTSSAAFTTSSVGLNFKTATSAQTNAVYIGILEISSAFSLTVPQVVSTGVSGGRNVYVSGSQGDFGYLSSTIISKMNVETLTDVSWLNSLRPVTFNYRNKDENGNYIDGFESVLTYGLIAEETEPINSDLVFYDVLEDGTKKLAGVEYNHLISPMLLMVQQLEKELEILESI